MAPCKALLDRVTDRAHIIETGTDSYRFRRSLELLGRHARKTTDGLSTTAPSSTEHDWPPSWQESHIIVHTRLASARQLGA